MPGWSRINPRRLRNLVPGWSRRCPLGAPLVVSVMAFIGPGPFHVGVDRGRSDFRDFYVFLSYHLLSLLRIPPVISGQGWLDFVGFFFFFYVYLLLLDSRFFFGGITWMH